MTEIIRTPRYTDLTIEQQQQHLETLNRQHWDLCDQLAAVDSERAMVMNAMKRQLEQRPDFLAAE